MSTPGANGESGAALPSISLEDLLQRETLREEWVDVPEWGARVKVRELSMGTYQQVQEESQDRHGLLDDQRLQINLCIAGIVEPDLGPDAYEWVKRQSMRATTRVLEAVMSLSGLGVDALEKAEATFPEAPGDDVEVPPSA